MKKVVYILAIATLGFSACKKDSSTKNTETKVNKEVKTTLYTANASTTQVHWTAYKTTDKTPVKGVFQKIKLTDAPTTANKRDALNNLTFYIPVSSFFSKNEIRDNKIKSLFFGVMENTTAITGQFTNIKGDDSKGSLTLNLKMNNNTVPVDMTYTITNNIVTLHGTLKNLMDWKMDTAFASLHKACELLHTGGDGASKTWTDVAISATTVLSTK